jgi:hypothetical protein
MFCCARHGAASIAAMSPEGRRIRRRQEDNGIERDEDNGM